VVPQLDGRFKVERQMLSASEMVAKADAMRAREASLRAGQAGFAHRSVPPKVAGNGHDGRLDDPAAAALLDRVRRSLAELAATVATLEERGIDLVRLKETLGTALPAGTNVFHVLSTLAGVKRRRGDGCGKAVLSVSHAQGKRPGRKPLDQARARAALQLVAAGLSPTAAARQLGLGRSTVYREVRRVGVQRSGQPAC
jgi:hypothetical protein